MTSSGYIWRKIFFCFCVLQYVTIVDIDGRRYDTCFTPDGRQGVCVVKRYCREATNQPLKLCEGDDKYCCPVPTTQRSAPYPSYATTAPRVTEPPTRKPASIERSRHELPLDRNQPRATYNGEADANRPVRNYNKPLENLPRSRNDPPREGNPPRPSYEDENARREVLEDRGKPARRPGYDERAYDSGDRPQIPGKVRFEDDRRGHEERPTKAYARDKPSSSTTNNSNSHNRRQQHASEAKRESRPSDTDRKAQSQSRDVVYEHEPRHRPEHVMPSHYPSKDQIESHRNPDPPRRSKPSIPQNPYNETARDPVVFPEPHQISAPQPQVPACGVKPYELFIAGGETSDAHEWPWMTAIFRRHQSSRPKTFLCGGSLINTKYVLTAAHCFVNNYVILPASSFVVRLGSHFLNSGEEYTVSNLVIHHNHSGADFFNDIALVRLASEVYITDKIAPICLPFPDMLNEDFVGRMAIVAGWGDTVFRTGGSRALQHVSVPIVSSEECSAAYSRVRGAAFLARGSDHVICAGLREGGKDACLGDSGGPLMLKTADDRWSVIGIVSLGYKCAEPGYPGVYTRVTHYMTWIHGNMKRY